MSVLEVTRLNFHVAKRQLLKDVSLRVERGVYVSVMGPSGSGKTTLLNCLAGIATPTSGNISIGETELTSLGAARTSAFRLRHIGMIFQFGELLPELNVLENVALPLRFSGFEKDKAQAKSEEMLRLVGLPEKEHAFPASLSGGETQRVGIARALVNDPKVILADEPTGSLDLRNTKLILDLLINIVRESKIVLVLTTHDPDVAKKADVVYRLQEGSLMKSDFF